MNIHDFSLTDPDNPICAPNALRHKKESIPGCFNKKALVRIAERYNLDHKEKQIDTNLDSEKLYEAINKAFSTKCDKDDQICWIHQPELKDYKKSLDLYFKSAGPKDKEKREWLSNVDISNVMLRFEALFYPEFKFYGPYPRDFMIKSLMYELGNSDMEDVFVDGIKKIGIVFNLDKHNQSGSHWVSMFIDTSKNPITIEFFDSVGGAHYKPYKEFTEFMQKAKKQLEKMTDSKIPVVIKINHKEHQMKGTECGVYSLHFIILRLYGYTFEDISENIIKDDEMVQFRDEVFR